MEKTMSEEDIDFLMSIQGLEQPEFDNAYLERENKKLEKEIERLNKAREIDIEYNKYLQKEIIRLNNIINDIDRYIHNWKLEDIGEKTMLILNDILLIKNGMSDEVIRLKGEDK